MIDLRDDICRRGRHVMVIGAWRGIGGTNPSTLARRDDYVTLLRGSETAEAEQSAAMLVNFILVDGMLCRCRGPFLVGPRRLDPGNTESQGTRRAC